MKADVFSEPRLEITEKGLLDMCRAAYEATRNNPTASVLRYEGILAVLHAIATYQDFERVDIELLREAIRAVEAAATPQEELRMPNFDDVFDYRIILCLGVGSVREESGQLSLTDFGKQSLDHAWRQG